MMINKKKPPLGLTPRFIHEEKVLKERLQDIKEAIKRYIDKELDFPNEWIVEYYSIIKILSGKSNDNTCSDFTIEEIHFLSKQIKAILNYTSVRSDKYEFVSTLWGKLIIKAKAFSHVKK